MTGHSWTHDVIAIGLVFLAIYALMQAFRIKRRNAEDHLRKLEKRASITVRQEWERRMAATKADCNTPRTLNRW